jgi:hypothetical protein
MNDAAEDVAGAGVAGEPLERGGRHAWRRLLLSFSLFNVLFPRGQLLFVIGLGFVILKIAFLFGCAFDEGLEAWVFFQRFAAEC